jgi:hypothetical protein
MPPDVTICARTPSAAQALAAGAHAGRLGWEANQRRMARLLRRVLDMAGGVERIRGFATNVSNHNALSGEWGKRLESSNPSPNELAYVDMFRQTLAREGIVDKGFLVDTGRNGRSGMRTRWGNWCNVSEVTAWTPTFGSSPQGSATELPIRVQLASTRAALRATPRRELLKRVNGSTHTSSNW